MYWMYDVPSLSNDHENILHHNKEVIDQFIAWKSETKKLFKEKKEVKEDIMTVLKVS